MDENIDCCMCGNKPNFVLGPLPDREVSKFDGMKDMLMYAYCTLCLARMFATALGNTKAAMDSMPAEQLKKISETYGQAMKERKHRAN